MEDRLELSGRTIAMLIAGALLIGLIALVATRGGGEDDRALTETEQQAFDQAVDSFVIELTFAHRPPRPPPASLLEAVFTERISGYAMALSEVTSGMSLEQAKRKVETTRRAIFSDRLKHALDVPTMRVLDGVLQRALLVRMNNAAAEHVDSLSSAVITFNNHLHDSGHRFAMYSYVNSRGAVWLLGYAVDGVVRYRAGSHVVTAIHARRLDNLNFHATAVGFASDDRKLAWVRKTSVEEVLVGDVLPQLGDEPPPYYAMDDRYDVKKAWFKRANQRAANVFRRDYGELMADPSAAMRLGKLLAQRKELLSRWYDLRQGFERTAKRMTRALLIPRRFKNALHGFPRDDLFELMDIEIALASPAMKVAFAAAMTVGMRAVEHHEVQHRVDFLHGDLRYPAELVPFAGALETEAGSIRRFAQGSNWELSAMVAEIARGGKRARSELVFQLRYLLNPSLWRSKYSKAILVIVDGLAEQLGVAGGPIRVDGALRRTRAVKLLIAITDKPGIELAAAAAALWQRLYGAPLVPVQRSIQ